MYGEGGNHFIHGIRRNPDITNIVHNNMVYGLTKGQASPTSLSGFKTLVQREGVFQEAFNPIAIAISLGASFVARAFAGNRSQTKEIIKKAISHKGYSLVDIFQPCVTYNRLNTYPWFKEKRIISTLPMIPTTESKPLEGHRRSKGYPSVSFTSIPNLPSKRD